MINIGFIGSTQDLITHQSSLLPTDFLQGGFYLQSSNDVDKYSEEEEFIKSIEELLSASDAIYIHPEASKVFELSIQSIRQGKHVFISNPLALNESEIHALMNNSHEANVKCLLGSEALCHPVYTHIKNQIKSPHFIDSTQEIPINNRQGNSTILEELMKNVIRIMQIVKSDIKRISIHGAAIHTKSLDLLHARLEFSNTAMANLKVNRSGLKSANTICFYEKHQTYLLDFTGNQSTILISTNETNGGSTVQEDAFSSIGAADILNYQLINFISSIQTDTMPILSLQEGLEQIEIADKISKKINTFSDV